MDHTIYILDLLAIMENRHWIKVFKKTASIGIGAVRFYAYC